MYLSGRDLDGGHLLLAEHPRVTDQRREGRPIDHVLDRGVAGDLGAHLARVGRDQHVLGRQAAHQIRIEQVLDRELAPVRPALAFAPLQVGLDVPAPGKDPEEELLGALSFLSLLAGDGGRGVGEAGQAIERCLPGLLHPPQRRERCPPGWPTAVGERLAVNARARVPGDDGRDGVGVLVGEPALIERVEVLGAGQRPHHHVAGVGVVDHEPERREQVDQRRHGVFPAEHEVPGAQRS